MQVDDGLYAQELLVEMGEVEVDNVLVYPYEGNEEKN